MVCSSLFQQIDEPGTGNPVRIKLKTWHRIEKFQFQGCHETCGNNIAN